MRKPALAHAVHDEREHEDVQTLRNCHEHPLEQDEFLRLHSLHARKHKQVQDDEGGERVKEHLLRELAFDRAPTEEQSHNGYDAA